MTSFNSQHSLIDFTLRCSKNEDHSLTLSQRLLEFEVMQGYGVYDKQHAKVIKMKTKFQLQANENPEKKQRRELLKEESKRQRPTEGIR